MIFNEEDLPDGWRVVTAGELTTVVGGGTPKTSVAGNFVDEGGHPWLTPSDLTGYSDKFISRGKRNLTDQGLETSSAKYMPAGTVLFSSRAPIGYVAIASNPITTNQGFRSFVPSDDVDSEYLYYALKLLHREAEQLASGTTFAELSGTNAKKLRFPLAPMSEQRSIAELLDHATQAKMRVEEQLHVATRALGCFRQSVLLAACCGRLTADVRADEESDVQDGLDDSGLPPLPPSWTYVPLDALRDPDAPIAYGIVLPGPQIIDGVPYVRQQDIVGGTVLTEALGRTTPEIAGKHGRSELRAGDVLLGIIRNLRVAIVPAGLDGANITQGMVRIRPGDTVMGRYLAAYLESPYAQRWMHDRYVGLAMPRINVADARAVPVPVPPLDEQHEIVERVDALLSTAQEVGDRVVASSATLNSTFQAVLQKAFSGGLTSSVPVG